ncbi:MFS transporter [Patescibacteria group bacterium]
MIDDKQNIKKQFFIFGSIATLISAAGYLIAPVEVRFLSSLTDNKILIGLTFALGSFFFAVLSLFLGRLSDKHGRGRFIIAGAFFSIIAPLLYAATINIFQYMGIKFIWALGGVALGPILISQMQDIIQGHPKRGQLMGTLYSVQAITGSGGAFLGGWLSEKYSFQAAYIAMAVLGLIAIVFLLSQLKSVTNKPLHYEKRDLLFSFKYIFSKPQLIFYFIANIGYTLNWRIKPLLWPLIIFGLASSDTISGSVFATMGIVAFLILPWAGRFVDRSKSLYKPALLSFLFLGVFGLVLSFTESIFIFWVAAGLYAIGESLYGPMQAVLLTDYVESKYRGEIMGFDAVFDKLIGTVSPFIAGFLLMLLTAQQVLFIYILMIWITLTIITVVQRKLVSPNINS